MNTDTPKQQVDTSYQEKISTWQVVKSVLAAGFGVQSEAARQRDFTYGRPLPYIIAGIVGTIIFVVTIITIVRVVLNVAGA